MPSAHDKWSMTRRVRSKRGPLSWAQRPGSGSSIAHWRTGACVSRRGRAI
jgi:hypothetical protein